MENLAADIIGNAVGLIVIVAVLAFGAGFWVGRRSKR